MLYYVNWKLTNAQLELLAADVSVVDYGDTKKEKKKKRNKGEFDDTKADAEAMRNAAQKWQEKYGNDESGAKNISIQDILGKKMVANVGVKVKDD